MPNSDHQHHRLAAVFAALISAVLLSACSIPGLRWEDSEVAGPPLASGQATRQFQRCTSTPSPWAPTGRSSRCDIEFRSANGVRVDALLIARDVSAALPRALPLRPLLQQFRSTARASGPTVGYTLYLVAVNPAVVVGVPEQLGDATFSAPGWTKYFAAQEYSEPNQRYSRPASFRVYYNTPPPVRAGSFVFVPEWQTESVPLSIEKQVASFSEKGTTITLVQRGDTWQSSRPVQ
jgi:hypothetical protein